MVNGRFKALKSELRSGLGTGEPAMRVLLIEDEPTTAKSIELMLGSEGFNVYTTDLGEEGLDLAKLYDYDIILLDLNLPDMHGYDVLKKVRTAKVSTPVLILSGIGEMDSKVRALGFGADDYVTKPFHRDELVARIHAIVRRSKGHSQSVIRTGKLAVNLDAKTVEVDGSRLRQIYGGTGGKAGPKGSVFFALAAACEPHRCTIQQRRRAMLIVAKP